MTKDLNFNVPYGECLYIIVHDDQSMINFGKIISRRDKGPLLHFPNFDKDVKLDFLQNFLVECLGKKIEVTWGNSGLIDELDDLGYELTSIPSVVCSKSS